MEQLDEPVKRPPILQRALRPILICFLSLSITWFCLGLYTQFGASSQPTPMRSAPVYTHPPTPNDPAASVYRPPIVAKAYRPVDRASIGALGILPVPAAIVALHHMKTAGMRWPLV